jgi:hypothetical protein
MKFRRVQNKNDLLFFCPGCGMYHVVQKNRWKIANEESDVPTVHPSILVRYPFWNKEKRVSIQVRCHLFIKGGKIQYLNDCTHKLAGQTVLMEDENVET